MLAFGQKENDRRGHAHVPDTVQDPVVALGLQETVDDEAGDGEREAGQVVLQQLFAGRIELAFCVADAHLFKAEMNELESRTREVRSSKLLPM